MMLQRELLKELLEYVEEQAKAIDLGAYVVSLLRGSVYRNYELQGLPGLEFDLRTEGDHIWLRISRLHPSSPPPVSVEYATLIRPVNDPFSAPPSIEEESLHAWIELHSESDGLEPSNEEDNPLLNDGWKREASDALQDYLLQWFAWAAEEKLRRSSIGLYGSMFALKRQIELEEATKPQELVWGIGVTSWQIPGAEKSVSFEYPLLTQAVEISIDEKSMAIEIRPRSTDTRVEMQAFINCSVPGSPDVERSVKEYLDRNREHPVSPFDADSYSEMLKLAASNLQSNGCYREILADGQAVPEPGTDLIVTDAWVLFSRLRTTHYLTDDLRRLKEKLDSGCDIPEGPGAFVTPPSEETVTYEEINFRGLSSRGGGKGKAEELYFPLPYNEEQVTIIQRLEKAAGVAVQGPPGTGKTHSIANVICHYLATGRRVLVTSRGEPALQVLQSKIPEEVRALTVALLASDREGVRQFQASIEAIQHQVSQLHPEETRHAITLLESAIDRAHQELNTIDRRIDEIALSQLSEVEIDGSPMRAQKLAELVVSGREQYGWFDDALTLSPEHAPPFSEAEAAGIREARRKVGGDLHYVLADYPAADGLPGVTEIAELHESLSRIRTIEAEVERGELPELRSTSVETLDMARDLLHAVDAAGLLLKEVESAGEHWPLELRAKCCHSSFTSEINALEALFPDIALLIESRAAFLRRPVEFPQSGLHTSKTREAVDRGVETGKPFGMFGKMVSGEAKQHIDQIRISGLPPATQEEWAHVRRYMELHDNLLSFVNRWNQLSDALSIPLLEGTVSALRQIELAATLAGKVHRLAKTYDAELFRKAEAVFAAGSAPGVVMESSAQLYQVKTHLNRHLSRIELSKATTRLIELHEKLAGKSGPVSIALREFASAQLGNPAVPVETIVAGYTALMAEIRRIASLNIELSRIREAAGVIARAGAEKLADRLCTVMVERTGEESVLPATWRAAWNWARMRTHIEQIEARDELLDLSGRRRGVEVNLSRFYRQMVSKAAWLATKGNATPKVLQALAGYATAIRKIGMGTGPNATRYRRDAREAMTDAAGAIPCWIMSHARISESMPPDIGAFDLVIVDEASQSDLWALPAILRGKKILVVGDDKQVSPDGGFISSRSINALLVRFLAKQPYSSSMTPGMSLYDLASRVFASAQVMLREHFRCVPPIIAYSNRVFYKGGIQPLRIPKATERIDPPLVDISLPDGYRDKRNVNEREAEAIAAEISAIVQNDAFAGRTIGVVSLLGMEQARHIDSLVRQQCDAVELLHRKFECGDARTFQGSERNIIFLSMVVDRRNCKALSGNVFDQRFNVAASRARDRMYLVRSVEAADLSEKDLRLSLLTHFNQPMLNGSEDAGKLVELCESGFEREFFTLLTALGYRVTPQVRMGAYRIDMVIEGAGDNRLAVELDGDEFHGPDRWQHDMSRQRVLERAGFEFWRCFASTWIMHKDEVLEELQERLKAKGIEPVGAMEYAPLLVEKRLREPEEPFELEGSAMNL
jgi:very-short-patch-repair endonuclease